MDSLKLLFRGGDEGARVAKGEGWLAGTDSLLLTSECLRLDVPLEGSCKGCSSARDIKVSSLGLSIEVMKSMSKANGSA